MTNLPTGPVKFDETGEVLGLLVEEVRATNEKVDALKNELALTNVRVETYQKASTQVVNLAFGLIVTAVIAIIANAVAR